MCPSSFLAMGGRFIRVKRPVSHFRLCLSKKSPAQINLVAQCGCRLLNVPAGNTDILLTLLMIGLP